MGQTAPQVLTPSFTLFREVIAHLDFMQVFWGGMDGWAPNMPKVCGVTPGVEPQTSCMRVTSATIILWGPDI